MTFAETQLAAVQALLASNPGATSVNVDGQSVTFAELTDREAYWQRRVNREAGTRPVFVRPNMGGV